MEIAKLICQDLEESLAGYVSSLPSEQRQQVADGLEMMARRIRERDQNLQEQQEIQLSE